MNAPDLAELVVHVMLAWLMGWTTGIGWLALKKFVETVT